MKTAPRWVVRWEPHQPRRRRIPVCSTERARYRVVPAPVPEVEDPEPLVPMPELPGEPVVPMLPVEPVLPIEPVLPEFVLPVP